MSRPWRFAVLFLILSLLCIGLQAQEPIPVASAEANSQLWLVELNSPPTADGGTAAQVKKDKSDFQAAAAGAKINYVVRRSFDNLWNGVSIQVASKDAGKLAGLPGVKAVYPDMQFTYDPRGGTSELDMASAVTMTGADLAQNDLGLTGKGVKVGVIDTGIDYRHPDLGKCFGVGCRVVGGTDLVGDAFNADPTSASYNPVPVPGPDPMDCAGHGTHVAGIIGANGDPATGGVRGVAPGITYYAYRVFGCAGSTLGSVMIDAMERALKDNVQVVNMSIGSAFQWPQYPTATAADRLVKRGIVVVSSAGNSGTSGLYATGAPGIGKDVIAVASFDNTTVYENYFTASPDNKKIGYLPASDAPAPPTSGSQSAVALSASNVQGCYPFSASDAAAVAGKIVLIKRGAPAGFSGSCSFYLKAFNAQSAGATGVILYNNAAGFLSPTVAGTPAITIPVMSITQADGVTLAARVASGLAVTFTDQSQAFPNPFTGGLISSYSSYGLSPDLSLKPDIGAPGGNIRSTYPLKLGGYAVLSGTSMASPHVAGTVALLLEAQPKLQARKVRDVLQNTARPALWQGNPAYGYLDQVSRQGAGMVNIYDAVLATTRVTPGKLSLGESQAGPAVRTLTVSNNSDHEVTYNLSHVDGLSVGKTFAPAAYIAASTVAFSADAVTVPAGGEVNVDVTITAPTSPDKSQYGGWIVMTPTDGGQVYRVPFAGFVGDYQSIQALAPVYAAPYAFPWLAKVVSGSFVPQLDGSAIFSMAGDDIPYVLIHFDHQVARIQLQVFDPISGRNYQFIDNSKYIPRNSTSTGFYSWSWDGTTYTPNLKHAFNAVPNGHYIIVVRALKALGDPDNAADWETWTSPDFTIARP